MRTTWSAVLLTLIACAPAAPAVSAASAAAPARPCSPHAVVLVRHAEKAPAGPDEKDPDLSPKGHERATRLATLLGKASITRLVATEYKRTQHTLAPLSKAIGKTIDTSTAAHSNALIAELRDAPPGSTTIVATHSNVIPRIATELGAPPLRGLDAQGNLPDDEYGRVLVLSVGCGTPSTLVELSSD